MILKQHTTRLILDTISIASFLFGLTFLFIPFTNAYGTAYYQYEFIFVFISIAFLLSTIVYSKLYKVLLIIYSLSMISLNIYFTIIFSNDQMGRFGFFFISFLAGSTAWISSCLIILRIQKYSSIQKSIFIVSLIFLAGLSYYFLRHSKIIWNLYRDEYGAHLIWMGGASLILLACTSFYFILNSRTR